MEKYAHPQEFPTKSARKFFHKILNKNRYLKKLFAHPFEKEVLNNALC